MNKRPAVEEASNASADVYSGDIPVQALTSDFGGRVYFYAVDADADPDVLARVANLFTIANVAPSAMRLNTVPNERVSIFVEMRYISAQSADMIRRKLAQLTCVISVEMTENVGFEKPSIE